jgi:hypothetical protein
MSLLAAELANLDSPVSITTQTSKPNLLGDSPQASDCVPSLAAGVGDEQSIYWRGDLRRRRRSAPLFTQPQVHESRRRRACLTAHIVASTGADVRKPQCRWHNTWLLR